MSITEAGRTVRVLSWRIIDPEMGHRKCHAFLGVDWFRADWEPMGFGLRKQARNLRSPVFLAQVVLAKYLKHRLLYRMEQNSRVLAWISRAPHWLIGWR